MKRNLWRWCCKVVQWNKWRLLNVLKILSCLAKWVSLFSYGKNRLSRKFCTKECMYAFRIGKPNQKRGKKYPHLQRAIKRNCLICKKQFRAVNDFHGRKQIYCSKICWGKRSPLWKRKCGFCKKKIRDPNKLQDKKQTYCSKACANKKMIGGLAPAWKGKEVGYSGLHKWIQHKLGKPKRCEHCGLDGLTGSDIHWANKSGEYRRSVKDWLRLCAKCHKIYDKK